MRRFSRLRMRLALRAALPAAAALLLVGAVVEVVLVRPMVENRDGLLFANAYGLQALVEEGGPGALRRQEEAWGRAGIRGWALLRREEPGGGAVLASIGSAPPPGAERLAPPGPGDPRAATLPDPVVGAWRATVTPVARSGAPGLLLAVAVPLDDVLQSQREIRVILAGAALAGVLLVGAGAWAGAGAVLEPLRGMTESARAVNPEHPGGGFRSSAAGDEFGDLGRLLEDLLARVGRALDEERRFAGEAAHEMRGPLAVLRIRVEEALASGDAGEREEALRGVLADVDRIDRLVQALLEMARAVPAGAAGAPDPGPLDVAAVLGALAPDFATLGEARGVSFRWTPPGEPVRAAAPREVLETAVSILVDNALRCTPPGGEVVVEAGGDGAEAWVEVRDTGPGVAADEADRVFDRLYRGRAGRAAGPGFGLGLALARRVARSSGGEVLLRNPGESGARFRVRLPVTTAVPGTSPPGGRRS